MSELEPAVTPGGMSKYGLMAIEDAILRRGYTQIGRHRTRHGDIYLCEKFNYHEGLLCWDVIWACRDGAQHLYCDRFSDRAARKHAAIEVALTHARSHNEVFGA